MRIAGIVTPTPNASDSPAEPAVCVMLFSRMVASRRPELRQHAEERERDHATGIEALTVSPTLSTRYSEDAPKTRPRIAPVITRAR
jgi:hypothetical protein